MYIIIQAIGKVMFDFFCTFTPTCKKTYTHICMQSHRQTHKQAGTHTPLSPHFLTQSLPVDQRSVGTLTVECTNHQLLPFHHRTKKRKYWQQFGFTFLKKKVKWWRERSFVFTVGWECARKVALRVSIYSVDFCPVTLSLILAKYSYKFQIAHFKKEHINS